MGRAWFQACSPTAAGATLACRARSHSRRVLRSCAQRPPRATQRTAAPRSGGLRLTLLMSVLAWKTYSTQQCEYWVRPSMHMSGTSGSSCTMQRAAGTSSGCLGVPFLQQQPGKARPAEHLGCRCPASLKHQLLGPCAAAQHRCNGSWQLGAQHSSPTAVKSKTLRSRWAGRRTQLLDRMCWLLQMGCHPPAARRSRHRRGWCPLRSPPQLPSAALAQHGCGLLAQPAAAPSCAAAVSADGAQPGRLCWGTARVVWLRIKDHATARRSPAAPPIARAPAALSAFADVSGWLLMQPPLPRRRTVPDRST
jgi:hypothetical protein